MCDSGRRWVVRIFIHARVSIIEKLKEEKNDEMQTIIKKEEKTKKSLRRFEQKEGEKSHHNKRKMRFVSQSIAYFFLCIHFARCK